MTGIEDAPKHSQAASFIPIIIIIPVEICRGAFRPSGSLPRTSALYEPPAVPHAALHSSQRLSNTMTHLMGSDLTRQHIIKVHLH